MNPTATASIQPLNRRRQSLKAAFEEFNRLSRQLQHSYEALQQRTGELSLAWLNQDKPSASRLEALLAALPAGVVVVDGAGVIHTANRAAEEFFGQILPGQNIHTLMSAQVSYSEGQDVLLHDGRVLTISRQPLAAEDGEIILFTDVSHTRRLQTMASRQSRLAAMGQMAAGLAHQIRTPLSSAMLYVSQLDQFHRDQPQQRPELHAKATEKIRASLRYVEKLVNDMLLYAKGGEFSTEQFSLHQLLVAFQARIEARVAQSGTQLILNKPHTDVALRGSLHALVSVLMNLAENAMQMCEISCVLEITTSQQDDYLVIAVRDNGPGIARDMQAHIFEPFFSQRSGGTGLGLAVAQAIAQAHHGDLLFKSEPGQGSTFYLCLPLNQGEQFLPSGVRA
jgi:two-component system sensor histidine kinase FlrB